MLSVQGSLVPLAPLPLTAVRVGVGALVEWRLSNRAFAAARRQRKVCPLGTGYNYSLACDTAERIIFAGVTGSGSGKLCWHSPFVRQRRRKVMPARIRGKSQLSIEREGFLDRRSKRCFWLLLSPQTKVVRAGARNSPLRRGRGALRRCAATPHPPPSGAPVSLRVGRFADLTRHRRVIQRRGPIKGEGLGVRHSHREPLKGKA